MKTCCFLTLLVILSTTLVAQRLVGREIIINPMFTELPSAQRDSLRWMSSVAAWGGFGHYAMGDREHAWYQKLGVLIELFRLGEQSSFSLDGNAAFQGASPVPVWPVDSPLRAGQQHARGEAAVKQVDAVIHAHVPLARASTQDVDQVSRRWRVGHQETGRQGAKPLMSG